MVNVVLQYCDNGTTCFKNVNNCLNINFTLTQRHLVVKVLIYIEMLFISSTPVLIRHLWQLKTVISLHWCLIRALLLHHRIAVHYLSIVVDAWQIKNGPPDMSKLKHRSNLLRHFSPTVSVKIVIYRRFYSITFAPSKLYSSLIKKT